MRRRRPDARSCHNGGRQPQNESAPYGAPNGYSGPNNGYSGSSNPYAYGGPSGNGMVFHSQAQVPDEQRRLNNIQAQLNRAQQELNSEWQQFNQARAQYEGQ